MKEYIIRHPQTIRNVKNKLTGWEKTKYSKKGFGQYKKILDYFVKNCIKYNIYSSDLPRALKLAKALSKKNKNPLKITPLLKEINFKETNPHNSYETQKQFRHRVLNFLKNKDNKNKIIITHSGVIEEILIKYFGKKCLKDLKLKEDYIFLIESNKNSNKLKIIRL
jgi:broad specificity phosphatase PhoE